MLRNRLIAIVLVSIFGLLVYLVFNGTYGDERSDRALIKEDLSPARVDRVRLEAQELNEVPSGDPRVRNFVDAEGRRAKMIRSDEAGHPIVEIDYRNGEELKIERQFTSEGQLVRERRFRNDVPLGEETLR
jgi:hypothetical protein